MTTPAPAENTIAWVYVYNQFPSMEAWEELQWRDGNWHDKKGQVKFAQLNGIEFIKWIPVWSRHRGHHLRKHSAFPSRNYATFRTVNGKRYVYRSTLAGHRFDLIYHKERKKFREYNFHHKNRYQAHRRIRPFVIKFRATHSAVVLSKDFAVKVQNASKGDTP